MLAVINCSQTTPDFVEQHQQQENPQQQQQQPYQKIPRVLVSGTGRAGTTFLMKILSFSGLDTGFDRSNWDRYVFPNCNGGLEMPLEWPHFIIKNTRFLGQIQEIVKTVDIQLFIIPVRNYSAAIESRIKNSFNANDFVFGSNGGVFMDVKAWRGAQEEYFNRMIASYVESMVKYQIPTIFLDFERMISDPHYLYVNLLQLFEAGNVTEAQFQEAYYLSELTSSPLKRQVNTVNTAISG